MLRRADLRQQARDDEAVAQIVGLAFDGDHDGSLNPVCDACHPGRRKLPSASFASGFTHKTALIRSTP